ncbi:heptaprenyl diphosphate synthase [Arthrobacter silviterrae]|uniref:Polyprenyl synthetase family protein n=1 Tax=Arthrobacter silviterrae TaxID=2026658 RepID=A0ABX0DAC8_9MICC|nr:polyprenyl synthetase family protein [Arthrobacter silviterrae]MDQ0277788.1 heptaprenyl diphosphate synthase [Arthrobacter silviterrae]NGN83846.1 polyprenyl synthetase family protein [Arthrobacter silviterrae]
MTTSANHSWTHAGHGLPATEDPNPSTMAIATGLALPSGFAAVAEDPELGPSIAMSMARVEKVLREAIANSDPLADATSRHLVEAGGKRIRPLLTLLAAHLGDASRAEVVQAAVVVELTHLATLYHDDVMDSAPYRRGAPTAHEVWGNTVAILTGDLIFARASILVSELGGRALEIQARTFERLCLGQLHETVGPRADEDPVEHYLSVIADKTGSLVAASGQLGAIFAGVPEEHQNVMLDYGEKVGIAFQLADDVIDVTGLKQVSGKSPGTDLREGVPTLPVLLLRKAAARGDATANSVLELVDGDLSGDDALAAAVSALRAHPATAESWTVARQWSADAIAALAPLPDGIVKTALASFAEAVVDRDV